MGVGVGGRGHGDTVAEDTALARPSGGMGNSGSGNDKGEGGAGGAGVQGGLRIVGLTRVQDRAAYSRGIWRLNGGGWRLKVLGWGYRPGKAAGGKFTSFWDTRLHPCTHVPMLPCRGCGRQGCGGCETFPKQAAGHACGRAGPPVWVSGAQELNWVYDFLERLVILEMSNGLCTCLDRISIRVFCAITLRGLIALKFGAHEFLWAVRLSLSLPLQKHTQYAGRYVANQSFF